MLPKLTSLFDLAQYFPLGMYSGQTAVNLLTSGVSAWMVKGKWLSLTQRSIAPLLSLSIIPTKDFTGQTITTSCLPTWMAPKDGKVIVPTLCCTIRQSSAGYTVTFIMKLNHRNVNMENFLEEILCRPKC